MPKPYQNKYGVWKLRVTFDGLRKQIDLGKIPKQDAEFTAAMVNLLVQQKSYSNSLSKELQFWIENLPPKLADSLGNAGLIDRSVTALTLKTVIEKFLEHYDRSSRANSTKRRMRCSLGRFPESVIRHPIGYFCDEERGLGRLERINLDLERKGYSECTRSKTNSDLSQVGNWAVKHGYARFNPFSALPTPKVVNPARNQDVPAATVKEIIRVCGDRDIAMVFALGRFAGLRTPSELYQLHRKHWDQENNTLSALNKDKQGEEHRKLIPVFPTLRAYLEEHLADVTSGNASIISDRTLRLSNASMFNKMKRAVKKAGFKVWPRLRQNLRASFENDLRRQGIGIENYAKILGHSPKTAQESYLKFTEKDAQEIAKKGDPAEWG